jgi:hypothetical protein
MPKRAMNPVWGMRKGTDIITAKSRTSPQRSIFSFFIFTIRRYVILSSDKDMNYFTYLCVILDKEKGI